MHTQIYATFGPSCGNEDTLGEMIRAGMTGMRLNLSHTTLSASENYIRSYQKVANEHGVKPQILIDMQGPELRVGRLGSAMELTDTQVIRFGKGGIPIPGAVISEAKAGDEILLDDGKLLAEVLEKDNESLKAKVLRGGVLQSHKSVKLKNRAVNMPVLTAHDIENIKHAKEYGVTALMQPFVLCGEDLSYVRNILKEHNAENIQIFAKIENRIGVENLEDIIPKADVIIIARGDLGNDMPLWELPVVQKQIEETCKKYKKPYIVVTQMLASMEEHSVPTRAEVSDIFHAVLHGAYGVMITGESAIGKYPAEAVRYLKNTALEAEKFSE